MPRTSTKAMKNAPIAQTLAHTAMKTAEVTRAKNLEAIVRTRVVIEAMIVMIPTVEVNRRMSQTNHRAPMMTAERRRRRTIQRKSMFLCFAF